VNPYRGDTAVTLGGRPYRLRLTTHAWAYLEVALRELGHEHLFDDKGVIRPLASSVVAVFWACLAAPHDSPPFTRAQVAALIDDAGGVDLFGKVQDPTLVTAWATILVNAGVLDKESAEVAGFLPSGKTVPKDEAAEDAARAPEPAQTIPAAST